MVKINGLAASKVARLCYCDPHTVTRWVRRYDEEGLADLEDKPCSGRPPKVKPDKIVDIVEQAECIITPKRLKSDIQTSLGIKYHITSVRRIMNRIGLSAKTVRRVHVNRASIEEIKRWQHNATRRISRLESKGFVTVVFDEAIFIDDPASGVKYWSPEGESIVTTYKGRHGRVVAYGAIATDGRQFFRTYKKFDKETLDIPQGVGTTL